MSKGLKALECIKHKLSALEFVLVHDRIPKKAPYIQETIFHIVEKELKALEIIKEMYDCKADITKIISDVEESESFEEFSGMYGSFAKEMYDLLKETFE